MIVPFVTERLSLRRYTANDQQDYFEIFGNPAIAKYDDFEPIDFVTAATDIQEILHWYETDAHEQSFAVEYCAEKKVIGCLYHKIEDQIVYIGYHFNGNYHGHGYASESVIAYVHWLMNEGYEDICAVCDPENKSSIHLLERVGFVLIKTQEVQAANEQIKQELVYQFKKPLTENNSKCSIDR